MEPDRQTVEGKVMDVTLNYYTPAQRIEQRTWFRGMVIRTSKDLQALYAEREIVRRELQEKEDALLCNEQA